jgi:predicted O-linked N-acetylglucosamine transferase (SPINDLY family)
MKESLKLLARIWINKIQRIANRNLPKQDIMSIEKKRKILYDVIEKDTNLEKIGISTTIKRIVEDYVAVYSLDFIYREIASFIVNIGHAYYARPYFKLSLERLNIPLTYSLYLQGLLIDPYSSEEEIYKEAIQYNQFFSQIKPYHSYKNALQPQRKLNVGYMCHFFYNSVSQSLLVPFLKEHHRDRVNVFCYSDAEPEQVNADTKAVADYWRDTKHLTDDQLATLIRKDKIDILLELNGHVLSNRFGVIARKPAPLQVNYYNQSATTGLKGFDYVFVGEDIELDQSKYTETMHKIKGVQGVAIFPDWFPKEAPSPCQEKEEIVFASFGAAHKVNTEVVKLWCQILKRVPHAKFFMKAGVLTFEPYLKVYQRMFTEGGIDLARIRFEGFEDHRTMLNRYADVDIALDTFPHAAGTTTMEATWQGIPVITLCGSSRYCSQNGRIVLTAVGHPELVAYSEEEYVNKAVELAGDKPRLLHYRKTLRNDFKNSTLANAKSFVGRLEDAYQEIWHKYCLENEKSYSSTA